MWIAPTVAVMTGAFLLTRIPAALPVAIPFLLLWLVSPVLTWWMSRPITRHAAKLAPEQIDFLRKLARRTWAYFETFVAASEHWLPPDNYQEVPIGTVAHRTSPTNMGMALLADLGAYDFGYLPAGRLVERLTNALHTMQSLERYRGHFYNWYDTQSLAPLSPRYISSVDSGNLAGHLLTLRAGLLALAGHRIIDCGFLRDSSIPRACSGIARRRCSDGRREACRDLDSACDASRRARPPCTAGSPGFPPTSRRSLPISTFHRATQPHRPRRTKRMRGCRRSQPNVRPRGSSSHGSRRGCSGRISSRCFRSCRYWRRSRPCASSRS
jgi:hypothetical protein